MNHLKISVKKVLDSSFFTLANLVTLSGILASLIFIFYSQKVNVLQKEFLIIIIALSDILDGALARSRKEVSYWGHFLDRSVRDTLVILIFFLLIYFRFPEIFHSNWFLCWIGLEIIFFFKNLTQWVYKEEENKKFYQAWNAKQALYFLFILLFIIQ